MLLQRAADPVASSKILSRGPRQKPGPLGISSGNGSPGRLCAAPEVSEVSASPSTPGLNSSRRFLSGSFAHIANCGLAEAERNSNCHGQSMHAISQQAGEFFGTLPECFQG
jgi:hypothetical protein